MSPHSTLCYPHLTLCCRYTSQFTSIMEHGVTNGQLVLYPFPAVLCLSKTVDTLNTFSLHPRHRYYANFEDHRYWSTRHSILMYADECFQRDLLPFTVLVVFIRCLYFAQFHICYWQNLAEWKKCGLGVITDVIFRLLWKFHVLVWLSMIFFFFKLYLTNVCQEAQILSDCI